MVLLLGGAAIMTVGTLIESRDTRDAAWSAIYGTPWFDFFLFLIGVNLAVAVINRIPIQRHQWPFVLTHFAIVVLLAGAWISRSFGYEGRMVIFEGERQNQLLLDSLEVRTRWLDGRSAQSPGGETTVGYALPRGSEIAALQLRAEGGGHPGVRIIEFVPEGAAAMHIAPGRRDGRAYVRIEARLDGKRDRRWLARGSSHTFTFPEGRALEVAFGTQTRAVPFSIALEKFELIHHPGSNRAAEYRSYVRVTRDEIGDAPRDVWITMNHPLDVAGFRLFQSSYQLGEEGRPDATVLAVSYDPGVPIVYVAFVLIALGIAWGLRTPRPHAALAASRRAGADQSSSPFRLPAAARMSRGSVTSRFLLTLALTVIAGLAAAPASRAQASPPIAAQVPLEETRGWAILADGRAKPIQTYANETALLLTGRERLDGLSSLEIFWGYALAAETFGDRPYIRIDSLDLKAKLGLEASDRRFSFNALVRNRALQELVTRALGRERDGFELDRVERDALAAYQKLEWVAGLISNEALTIVPFLDARGGWTSPVRLAHTRNPSLRAIYDRFGKLARAHRDADRAAFAREARALTAALRSANPTVYPPASRIARELFYEDFNAFGWAWKLYLAGFLVVMLVGFSARPWGYATGLTLISAGFVCHSTGIGIRWDIAGRAPVSNLYESLVFMGWGAIALGLGLEVAHRKRFPALSAGLIGFLCLAFSENLPIDSAINPLVPVLANTSWLAVHVMTIMLSYAALALAMVLGHAILGVELARRDRGELLSSMTKLLHRTLQIGILFLAAGIMFGAVWANESWGRYWGWDPKETWSLITFFVYLAIIHARFAGWLHAFGLAVSAVLGFLAVIMTYYGVNFILSAGMHAYGFAEGGQLYVAAYAVIEVALIIAAYLLRSTRCNGRIEESGAMKRVSV